MRKLYASALILAASLMTVEASYADFKRKSVNLKRNDINCALVITLNQSLKFGKISPYGHIGYLSPSYLLIEKVGNRTAGANVVITDEASGGIFVYSVNIDGEYCPPLTRRYPPRVELISQSHTGTTLKYTVEPGNSEKSEPAKATFYRR